MSYFEFDTGSREEMLRVTYRRECTRTVPICGSAPDGSVPLATTETLTFHVHASAFVEIRVSTDPRGLLKRIVHHPVAGAPQAPTWGVDQNGKPYGYLASLDSPLDSSASADRPSLTFVVDLEPRDVTVAVSVDDRKDSTTFEKFIELAGWRSDGPTPPRRNRHARRDRAR